MTRTRLSQSKARKDLLTTAHHPADMRLVLILVVLTTAACNTPSREFRGVEARRIAVEGSTFDVRVRGELAEAIRVNAEYAPRMGPIADRAALAVATVSGCVVTRVTGDQALTVAQLDCDGRPNDYVPPPAVSFECERIGDPLRLDGDPRYADYDCASF